MPARGYLLRNPPAHVITYRDIGGCARLIGKEISVGIDLYIVKRNSSLQCLVKPVAFASARKITKCNRGEVAGPCLNTKPLPIHRDCYAMIKSVCLEIREIVSHLVIAGVLLDHMKNLVEIVVAD